MTDGRKLGVASREFTAGDLRAAMLMCELDNARLAALCGVTPRAVQLWVAGERPIPLLVRRVLKAASIGLVSIRTLECMP